MEVSENEETDHNEQYMFLNFKGRVPEEILQESVFLKVANLNKNQPLVQVNELLFKGHYDHSIGTNLFFQIEETSNSSSLYPFEKQYPIDLNFIKAETKVMVCEQVKLKPQKAVLPESSKKIKFNLNCNYDELLQKFADKTLNIKDMVLPEEDTFDTESSQNKAESSQTVEAVPMETETNKETNADISLNMQLLEEIPEKKMLGKDYQKLLRLAKRPMKMKVVEEPEFVECDENCREIMEYRNIECKILEPPYFQYEINSKVDVTEASLCNFIDIDRCKLFGLLDSIEDFPRPLTEEEKKRILVLENLDLLSLQARYIVIQKQIEKLENYITNVSKVLSSASSENCTAKKTLETYNKLKSSLERRINEIRNVDT